MLIWEPLLLPGEKSTLDICQRKFFTNRASFKKSALSALICVLFIGLRRSFAGDLLVVMGAGGVAGGLIGSGVGLIAYAGAGAGFSGLGYMVGSMFSGS